MIFSAATSGQLLIELGGVLLALAVVGRFAAHFGLPSIPLYLIAGLLAGDGGVVPLDASGDFLRIGADLGVVMLLLLLGLEYSSAELLNGLRSNWLAGLVDLVANFGPGLAAGLLLGWGPVVAILLGGVTYISSSGIIAKQLSDLDRIANRETPLVLSILVIEDLVMALYLPVVGVLIVGVSPIDGTLSVVTALAVVGVALVVSARYSEPISRIVETRSSELLLLSVLGLTLFIGGLAEEVRISAAVSAFLVGVTLSGSVAERGRELLTPLRDVFGGLFFVFFGLQIDPSTLPPVVVPALLLAGITAATKAFSGWWSAGRAGIGRRGRLRVGASLLPRGEFSIVIAGIGTAAGLETDLGPLSACYVLVLAVAGSLAMRYVDRLPLLPRSSR